MPAIFDGTFLICAQLHPSHRPVSSRIVQELHYILYHQIHPFVNLTHPYTSTGQIHKIPHKPHDIIYPMNSTQLIYAIVSGVLPSLLWLWFWLKEDNLHPEPKSLLTGCFIGGAVAVAMVIPFQMATMEIADESLRYMVWAGIEEILKFGTAFFIALRAHDMDEPIDAMIYMITVALGFAAAENILFILGPLSEGDIARTIVTGNLRFVGATLVHVVSSAMIGLTIGLAFYKEVSTKILFAIIGVILSIVLHTSFNLAIINATALSTLKVFGWVWCGVVVLIILFEEVKAVKPRLVKSPF